MSRLIISCVVLSGNAQVNELLMYVHFLSCGAKSALDNDDDFSQCSCYTALAYMAACYLCYGSMVIPKSCMLIKEPFWHGHDFLFLFHLGSNATNECPSIIPDIMDDYLEVKDVFVDVCTTQGTPTLDQVKDRCIDLIECTLKHIPRIYRYAHEDNIEKAETLPKLARVVCFQLSSWISYDFFRKVIARFQPALKIVKERLMRYEGQLKVLLQQKLEYIAELQQR